ncbi:glucose-6-phosphate dehydrogenase [Priestia megaterium]|uniref:glucose-6-phosphate dehydrogenase n=1 Tax=Priestia megaterium TaxID=1404 RepID=UPI0036D955FA
MEAMTFVLFGSTGDLAKRKIYPALYNLFVDGKISKSISVVGLGRREMSDADFQKKVEESIHTFSRRVEKDSSLMQHFLSAFRYSQLDATNAEDYKSVLNLVEAREAELKIPSNRMFYLSVAPEFFGTIAEHIKDSGLGATKGWKRLIIEKPFGHDLKSARQLNENLSKAFKEKEIYRIDHYLGKSMVQNLEALEFANPILQSLWNNEHIANIQITASETVGVEERASYYDHSGAIRDMVQNHMLQMLMMTAMHLPARISADDIRNEKINVLKALRPLVKEEMDLDVVRGQYEAGKINGASVPSYINEPGVSPSSQTDTFLAARLYIDNSLWKGVPFYIRTGKRMAEKATRIVIEFKDSLKELYLDKGETTSPNLLIIEINPHENITLQLNSKNPFNHGHIEPVQINFSGQQEGAPEAYERLIADACAGDSTFFAHWKEVELAWEWVQPLLEAFEENTVPLYKYAAGSHGPDASNALLEKDGFKWWLDEKTASPSREVQPV